MADPIRCIAIIGAGFSGAITAVNLLRQEHEAPVRIVLIDRDRHARGAAYAAHAAPYLLNVPAGRMSALACDPTDFLRFAQRSLPDVTAEDFLPRSLYGEYLEETLRAAERNADAHVTLDRVRGEVQSLQIWRPQHTYILGFADGREIAASEVVLAFGNPPPAPLPGAAGMQDSEQLVDRPLTGTQALSPDETVLVVGTGLTMADIALMKLKATNSTGVVHAISRHGLLPLRQTAFRHAHAEFDAQALLRAASTSARALFRAVRQISRDAERKGGDWREAITFVRNIAPRLWTNLTIAERKRFLRHVRPYWEVHRHRLPPQSRQAIDALRDAKRLMVHAGQILRMEPDSGQVLVTYRPRGLKEPTQLRVDRVVNCTGPDYRCRSSTDPLIHNLLQNGLIQPDALGTGLRTGSSGRVLNQLGHVTRGLYYIGPMLRADHWEATAVGELREHAESLAQHLARTAPHAALAHSVSSIA